MGNGLLVAGLVVSTASSRLGLACASMEGEDVGDADADALDSTTPLGALGLLHEKIPRKNSEVGEERHRRSLHEKSLNRRVSQIAEKKKTEVGEEVRRRSLHENFTTDVHRELL